MKEIGMYLAKRVNNGITSSFVVMRTNLFPSDSLTHATGGMESIGSEAVSLTICHKPPVLYTER